MIKNGLVLIILGFRSHKMSDSEDESATDHQLKVVLLGDGTAGKVSNKYLELINHFYV